MATRETAYLIGYNIANTTSNITSHETLQEFRQLFEQHQHIDIIYTDGSKTETDVQCAVYNSSHSWTLPPVSTIYTCELYAICQSLLHFNHFKEKRFTIFSDSMSSLQAIQSIYGKIDPLINKIQVFLHILKNNHQNGTLVWIPGHSVFEVTE